MATLGELKTIGDCLRRIEADYFASENEIIRLKREVAELREQLKEAMKVRPGKLPQDCRGCVFRIQALKSLEQSDKAGV